MEFFITGDIQRQDIFREAVKTDAHIDWYALPELPRTEKLEKYDVIIDLNLDEQQENLETYAPLAALVMGCAVKNSLAQMTYSLPMDQKCKIAGLNALPGFLGRPLTEISFLRESDKPMIETTMVALGLQPAFVADRIGMVTPRILFMIINEAYYTLQEGTATAQDIDLSMKLGTNYPHGPFEWSRMIGIRNIYETLEALYQDTHDERYKICPLLKNEYLRLKG